MDKASVLKEVQKHLGKGAIDKAISELDKLVKESPDGNTFNMIGDLYLRKGSQKSAIEFYQKAANYFRHEGFYQKAQALYKKVLNLNASDSTALYAFGELSEEKGLVTDAIKYYLASADALSKEGKKDGILGIYQKILSLSPSNVPLRIKVAEILIKEGLESDAAREYLHIAVLHEEKSEFEKSREFFHKSIDLYPRNREALLGLSLLHEKTGDISQATVQIKKAAALFPEDPDILLRSAELSLLVDAAAEAKQYLVSLTKKEPKHAKARRMLGELYFKAGSPEKAWEQYLPVLDEILKDQKEEDAIHLLETFKPVDPVETGARLIALARQMGDNDRACDELVSLGDHYVQIGREEDGLSCYKEALDINPAHHPAEVRLAPRTAEPGHGEEPGEEMPAPAAVADLPASPEEALDEVSPSLPSPSEEVLRADAPAGAPETGETEELDKIVLHGEKSFDEIMTEVDIFSRYGLLNEAQNLLETVKGRFPQNIDVHIRLKALYRNIGEKELAVTECIILSQLYTRAGDDANSAGVLEEAYEISPEDPRLAGRAPASPLEPTSFAASSTVFGAAEPLTEPSFEDYEEELTEADFYTRQGLITEAIKILEKLQRLFPGRMEIIERLEALGQTASLPDDSSMAGKDPLSDTLEAPGQPEPSGQQAAAETMEPAEELEMSGSIENDAGAPVAGAQTEASDRGGAEFEDFSLSDSDLVEAQEMPEPTLDSDVLEIFQEFKKGLEKELGDEDSETHYNLGIAYKEMGLVDDAIKEFQTSRNDEKRFLQSSTMLGVCYIEKGLYSLAIDVLNDALLTLKDKDDAYWALRYELAEAYEKNQNLKEALTLYTEIYGWNAKFRNISDKLTQLQSQARGPGGQDKEKSKEQPKERKNRVSYL